MQDGRYSLFAGTELISDDGIVRQHVLDSRPIRQLSHFFDRPRLDRPAVIDEWWTYFEAADVSCARRAAAQRDRREIQEDSPCLRNRGQMSLSG